MRLPQSPVDAISAGLHHVTSQSLFRNLILASASPRRRELLAQLGMTFTVVVAAVTEHEDPTTDPRLMVEHNAILKTDWVSQRNPGSFVLGADTTVFVDGHALNKPANLDEARSMLRRLSGRSHTVFTGLALQCAETKFRAYEGVATTVCFRPLTELIIEDYISKVHVLDKAGAYGIQEHGDLIVDHFDGSYTNIVGLPVETTKQMLERAGLLPP